MAMNPATEEEKAAENIQEVAMNPAPEEEKAPVNIQDLLNDPYGERPMDDRLADIIRKSEKQWLKIEDWEVLFQNANEFEVTDGPKMESLTDGLYRIDFKADEDTDAQYEDANEWRTKGENKVADHPYNGRTFELESDRESYLQPRYQPYCNVPHGILIERQVISSNNWYPKIRFVHYYTSVWENEEARKHGLRYSDE